MRSAPARAACLTCSPNRAKSAARIEGAILRLRCTCLLRENVDEFTIPPRNIVDCLLARTIPGSPVHKCAPEACAPHREPDETRNAGGGRQPLVYFFVVLATSKKNTADPIAPPAASGLHDFFAVLASIQPFDLPHLPFDYRVL